MDEAWDNPLHEDNETEGLIPLPEEPDAGTGEPPVQSHDETPTPKTVTIEDMTLAEFIGHFWRSPASTGAALGRVLRTPAHDLSTPETIAERPHVLARPAGTLVVVPPSLRALFDDNLEPMSAEQRQVWRREMPKFGLRLAALLIGLYGCSILAVDRTEQFGLDVGAPYLLAAFLLWLFSEVFESWPSIARGWRRRSVTEDSAPMPVFADEPAHFQAITRSWLFERAALAVGGLAFSILTSALTVGNLFRPGSWLTWFISVALWVAAFAPPEWSPRRLWAAIRGIRLHTNTTFWLLVIIFIVGAFFRVSQLAHIPPEMTSDHVEKLLDAQRTLNGETQVFFPNNGGREPFQMYAMALLSQVPGLGMNFTTLKLLTAIEGLVTLPVLWWMGRVVVGKENPQLGNMVGLALAALVAVSYWDVALSRLGLRIVLTVLVTALLIIFLTRALRDNRRGDFILAGLTLGFGLYTYQAVRMLPVVVLIGVGLAVVFKAKTFLERRTYVVNLAVLVVVALAAFVPMLTFALQYPDNFWMRTSGRLFGDDIITTVDQKGNLIERQATLQERVQAFQKNLPVLISNIRNALLMYNWKGDVLWFSAVPNRPAMDALTGALLIIGLAAWLARMFRRRDVADWLLPIMLFVMLLPSAFSIAYPIENPSATRTSGTLPEAYLFAALPLALLVWSLAKLVRGKRGLIAGGALAGVVLLVAGSANYQTYFTDYYEAYFNSSPAPYTQAGAFLKGFANSGGAFGNAFMLGYPYWWDHRAIGIEAGLMDWPNGVIDPDGDTGPKSAADEVPQFLYLASQLTSRYRFDPEKDILFFYSPKDEGSDKRLPELFPTGYAELIKSQKPNNDFKVFRVPAMGANAFIDFLVKNGAVAG